MTITWWISHSGNAISESIMSITAWVLTPSWAGVLRGRSPTCAASNSGNSANNMKIRCFIIKAYW